MANQIFETDNKLDSWTHMINLPMLSKYQLLIFGFSRNLQSDEAPIEVVNMINSYYPHIAIYGVGKNDCGELSVGNKKEVKQFIKLEEMSALCDFPQNLQGDMCRFIIFKKLTNEIYAAGDMGDGEAMSRVGADSVVKFGKMKAINDDDIVLISTGFSANYARCMTNKSNFYIFGPNSHSDGTEFEAIFAEKLSNIFKDLNVKSINVGFGHTMYLMYDGSVYGSAAYGNRYGQIGVKEDIYYPRKIESLNNHLIIQMECGTNHTICLDNDHNIIVFGNNDVGQLGLGHNEDVEDAITINNYFKNRNIDITKIKSGSDHSICIDNNGNGYMFGDNQFGQIGNGKGGENMFQTNPYLLSLKNIIAASVSENHSIILTMDHVFTFGSNDSNQCSPYTFDQIVMNTPYLLSTNEIGINKCDKVVNVIAGDSVSVIVVNEC